MTVLETLETLEKQEEAWAKPVSMFAYRTGDALVQAHEKHIEKIPEAAGKLLKGVGLAVEFSDAARSAWRGDYVQAEDETVKAIGGWLGMEIGASAGAAGGLLTGGVGVVPMSVGGGMFGLYTGEHYVEKATDALHERFGKDTPLHESAMKLVSEHVSDVVDAIHSRVDQLAHPTAQKLLDQTRDTMHQMQVAHEVAQNVDVNLAAPVLNTFQKIGGAENVSEAARELAKLGAPSDATYGKAAVDMAAMLTMGERYSPQHAADHLDHSSAGEIVPQYDVHATRGNLPGALAARAANGDLSAQHALLSQASLEFTPRNGEALTQIREIVRHESQERAQPPNWQQLDAQLGAANAELAKGVISHSAPVQTQVAAATHQTAMER